eukprot:1024051_1
MSSLAARFKAFDVRYGCSKAALSYATHALRKELSPRFGIWCSVIEPGGFQTNIMDASLKWTQIIVDELKENGKEELIDIYEHDMDATRSVVNNLKDNTLAPNCQPVIDDMLHALTAKYPKREYVTGWNIILGIAEHAPLWVFDAWSLKHHKNSIKKMSKIHVISSFGFSLDVYYHLSFINTITVPFTLNVKKK